MSSYKPMLTFEKESDVNPEMLNLLVQEVRKVGSRLSPAASPGGGVVIDNLGGSGGSSGGSSTFTISEDLNMNNYDIINVTEVDGVDVSAIALDNMPAAAAGDIDCGGQAVTNVGNVDGVDVSAIALDNMPAASTGAIDCDGQSISNVGTVDSRNISTDGAKLDSIEAGADVTDFANVRIALAAATAYVDFNGQNIQGVGSVDGRDVSADGSKLDNIEANADVTDFANVQTALAAASGAVTFNSQNLSSINQLSTPTVVTGTLTEYGLGSGITIASDVGFHNTSPTSQASHISDPAGGATQDAEARSAINSILVVLENHGLTASS